MNRLTCAIGAMALAMLAPAITALAQPTTEAAKVDGKSFGRDKARAAQAAATTAPDASRVPNYGGVPGQSDYFDDPERMAREAGSQATTHTGYRTMRDSMNRRARFAPTDLDAVIARSRTLSEDPLAYTSGMAIGGTQGRCVPLPAASGSAGRYTATCNTGYAVETRPASCAIPATVRISEQPHYRYYAENEVRLGIAPRLEEFRTAIAAGTCGDLGRTDSCRAMVEYGYPQFGRCSYERTNIVECSAPIPGLSGRPHPATGELWFARQLVRTATAGRDESRCGGLAANDSCTQDGETCTDSDPVTRIVEGVAVTQPCWAWSRRYTCAEFTAAQDCEALETTPGCHLVGEECLAGEPCRTWEQVYDCPVPDQPGSPNQFICDGDVYCIDGSCETIEREANTEFKDAVVALNAMNQARRELDADTLTLFKGERQACSSKVFGVLNCCKGKGFPLIPGISLLVALGCDREEVLLHERDAQGLCAYVGTYCSDSFLGVCLTKRKVYCCFESKLSRILQEQGRRQLNKPWGAPKREQCLGFTVAEFARLDLSQMDFSEVYAEFTAAARLPDELEAATAIQQKIEDYYARARP